MVVGGAAAATVLLWFGVAPYMEVAGGTRVFSDAQPLRCADGQATTTADIGAVEPDEPVRHAVAMTEDLDCVMRFFVANETGHAVTIDRISVPLLSPGAGGPAVQADSLLTNYNDVAEAEIEERSDVAWPVGDPLLPGETLHYAIALSFDETGCSTAGGSVTIPDIPTVTVSFRGRDSMAHSETVDLAFVGTEDSSCDS